MKRIAGAVLAVALAGGVALRAAEPAPGEDLDKLPLIVPDESAKDWVVDRFAGNSTAGQKFYQGPAREVGGLGRCRTACGLPDGTVYLGTAAGLAEISPDGFLRLFMGNDGFIEGPLEQVRAGAPIYSPKEKTLYLTGPNCLRRVVEKPDGTRHVEVVAGTPNVPGQSDGPARAATFKQIGNAIINSQGTIYVMDFDRLRKIEDGQVTTLNRNMRSGKLVDGPLAQACFSLIASRVEGWKPIDSEGVPVAASPAGETNPALASDGAGRLLCVYEKHLEDGRVQIAARTVESNRK